MPKCKRSGHADKEDEDSRGADVCDSYGWSFPNPNPSDRRSHKRVCGTNEGDRPGNDDAPHKIHLDVEHVSDPNAAPTGMCVAESSVDGAIQPMTSEENNHSDETKHIAENPNPNATGLCVGESSDSGAIQPKNSEENIHSDETEHIAENLNPNAATGLYVGESADGGAIQAMASTENIHSEIPNDSTGLCVGESSDGGAIQPMASTDNIHSDETKRIAENADQSTNEYFEFLKRGFALARAMNEAFFRIKDKANMKSSECEVKVKINEYTTLRVVPRIKLNFTFGCAKGDIGWLMSECQVKKIIINKLRLPRHDIFLTLFDDDVHVHYVSEPKWTNDGDMFVVAKGFVFIRDSKILKTKEAVGRNRDYFLKKMSRCTTNFPNASCKIRLSLPSGEDAKRMMSSISKTQSGVSMEPPTLVMKGLPFEWFAEQPDFSKPSKQLLLHFFSSFGNVRKLDVFGDEVFIQFEDYYKPLQLLCSSSLQKEGCDEIADYKIVWKDEIGCDIACEDTSNVPHLIRFLRALGGQLVVTPPAKNQLELQKNIKTLQERAIMIQEELKGVLTHLNELVQELN